MLLLCFLLARIALLLPRFCFGCLKQIFGLVKFLQLFLPVFFVLYFAVYVRIKQVIIKVYLKKKYVCCVDFFSVVYCCGCSFFPVLLLSLQLQFLVSSLQYFWFHCHSPVHILLLRFLFF